MDGGIAPGGRIGPNAIIQAAAALDAALSVAEVDALFAEAGLARYRRAPPDGMVEEREVTALHRVLRARLPEDRLAALVREAGWRTGDYLLAHRIPRPVQWVLKRLPAPLAARLLLSAIRRHAWTFVGSGRFEARPGRPLRLAIAGCPLCRGAQVARPACDYYAASFERLFAALVHPRARVTEVACEAMGDAACLFAVEWRGPAAR
ncbi:bacteriochlorophyll 4-vinyl reductase [Paracraurococcus lichenis]|uniref:Bacteriochlorophyll 4-vinyl reductase n=1 Tax=Paracraurococcus lichenis TaxID=3064888 RepID=A0ABT9DUA3_9PROT|nr:bacteriochlorophyll 4-vinyl reductase [Paracraurococcus sp. LOR1-02]MDO9707474.1 bacteriochlorophyll 4-vinyl reductase [Paracraurococcus sp. LOR1-02]